MHIFAVKILHIKVKLTLLNIICQFLTREWIEVDMFQLILCGVLIPSIVSANADYNSENLKFSTTLPTLPLKAILAYKNCVLIKKKSEISKIVELFKSDRVHVVDIRVIFSGNGPYQLLLSDLHVKLLNPIGQEILYTLKQWRFKYVTWTLNAGIRHFELNVEESRNDCVDKWKSVADFVFENIQDIVWSMNMTTNYKVWYSFKERSSGKVRQICCPTTTYNLSKCNHEFCSKDNSLLYESDVLWNIVAALMLFCLWCGVVSLLFVFLSCTQFNLKYPEYYKLEESMMSPFSIFFKIVCEACDGKPSFIRSCSSLGIILYFIYLRLGRITFFDDYILLFFFWGLIFSIPCLFKTKITKKNILEKVKEKRNSSSILLLTAQRFACDSNVLRVELSSRESRSCFGIGFENRFGTILRSGVFVDVIEQLTLPFNLKFWKGLLLCDFITPSFVRMRRGNRIFKILMLCLYVLYLKL